MYTLYTLFYIIEDIFVIRTYTDYRVIFSGKYSLAQDESWAVCTLRGCSRKPEFCQVGQVGEQKEQVLESSNEIYGNFKVVNICLPQFLLIYGNFRVNLGE